MSDFIGVNHTSKKIYRFYNDPIENIRTTLSMVSRVPDSISIEAPIEQIGEVISFIVDPAVELNFDLLNHIDLGHPLGVYNLYASNSRFTYFPSVLVTGTTLIRRLDRIRLFAKPDKIAENSLWLGRFNGKYWEVSAHE